MRLNTPWVALGALGLFASAANAAAPPDQVARLGQDLTPLGATKAGNAAGTIPEWTGGITAPPAGYAVGKHHPDPFASDAPQFTVSQSNSATHRAQLSAGQQAMFAKYANFAMNVYPTRRSASFPQRIYDKTRENAASGKLLPNGAGVADVAEGIPFPITRDPYELIWNHKLKFKGVAARRWNPHVAPTATGQYSVVSLREEIFGPYWKQGNTLKDIDNILTYFFQVVEAPPRLAGSILLVHETLNQDSRPRQAWLYNPGQRRVRKAPQVAYDNPATASDGLSFNDMTDMFNGALDRFDWVYVDTREMLIPYNAYKAHSDQLKPADLVRAGHLNPEHLRYELHRVHIVDAKLKTGVRHSNSRRTFYLDEDSYQIVMIEHYDSGNRLWRYSEAHPINYYEMPLLWTTLEVHHDLLNGRYIAYGLDNQSPPYDFAFKTEAKNFTPQALRTRGTR
jgi:hypothetical protein